MLPAPLNANIWLKSLTDDPTQSLMTATMAAFEQVLGKGVLGTPVTVGDVTIIPVTITTFGVGAGGGSLFGEPVGGGGGGGIVPVALILITPDGVRVETLPTEATATAMDKLTDMATDLAAHRGGRRSTAAR